MAEKENRGALLRQLNPVLQEAINHLDWQDGLHESLYPKWLGVVEAMRMLDIILKEMAKMKLTRENLTKILQAWAFAARYLRITSCNIVEISDSSNFNTFTFNLIDQLNNFSKDNASLEKVSGLSFKLEINLA